MASNRTLAQGPRLSPTPGPDSRSGDTTGQSRPPTPLIGSAATGPGPPVPAEAKEPLIGPAASGPPRSPVALNPRDVESFKQTARSALAREGIPADQIEKRLDSMVAAAAQPLTPAAIPELTPMPGPGFFDKFGDGWNGVEESARNLSGQAGPGAPGVLESWRDLAKGINAQVTDPVGTAINDFRESPSLAAYLGEKAGAAAINAPAMAFGGEGALGALGLRAGALEDLGDAAVAGHAGVHEAIPHPHLDTPTIEHHTPLADIPSHHLAPVDPGPLHADSPLFDGYHPTPHGPEFTNPDGSLIYPEDSLPSKPYAIPGTVIDNADLPKGTIIDRFGSPFGSWLSPDGTLFAERALPLDSAAKSYYQYVVDDPMKLPPGYRIEESQAAPWFHQPGGGTQYRIIAPEGQEPSVQRLVNSGFLRQVERQ